MNFKFLTDGARASAHSAEYLGKMRRSISENDIFAVKILLDFGVSSERIINELITSDCRYDDIDSSIFVEIVSKLSNINELNASGHPIILRCIFNGQIEEFKLLISNFLDKIDWNYETKDGRNLAFWASCARDDEYYLEFLNCLWQTGKVDMIKQDIYGANGATLAIRHDRPDALMFLIEQCKIDINTCDIFGNSLLHICCDRGRPNMVQYLLSKGANIELKNANGQMAIDIANLYNWKKCFAILTMKMVSMNAAINIKNKNKNKNKSNSSSEKPKMPST